MDNKAYNEALIVAQRELNSLTDEIKQIHARRAQLEQVIKLLERLSNE